MQAKYLWKRIRSGATDQRVEDHQQNAQPNVRNIIVECALYIYVYIYIYIMCGWLCEVATYRWREIGVTTNEHSAVRSHYPRSGMA